MTEEIRIRGADDAVRRVKLEVVLSQAQEELLHVGDVRGGVGVEDDHIVEVGSDAVGALADLVDGLDELP